MSKNECKYCSDFTGFTTLNNTVEYSTVEIAINPYTKVIRARHFPNGYRNGFRGQDAVVVKFCPMCGRKL